MNDYFCVLPFYSIETDASCSGKNIYCCRLEDGTNIEDVRNSIIKKERSKNCQVCWSLEDQGLKSERQIHNEMLDYYLDISIENLEENAIKQGFRPLKIKLHTSNVCNGTCVTCNSDSSSAWSTLQKKYTKYISLSTETIDGLNINWSEVAALSFVGGEPLLEKKNFQILQTLINLGNTNCFISIVTNGSVYISDSQFETLSKFKNLNICLSIDGTESVFDYMRYPTTWGLLLENIEKFKKITNLISASVMISNLNILYYQNLVDFFKENNIQYLFKPIISPDVFNPGNLPDSIIKKVLEKNPKSYEDVLGFIKQGLYSDALWQDFKTEVARQDQLKNISISGYLPELYELIKNI